MEGDVVNKNAVLYWDMDSDNKELINEIKSLHKNNELYNKFVSQKIFIADNALCQIKLLYEKI